MSILTSMILSSQLGSIFISGRMDQLSSKYEKAIGESCKMICVGIDRVKDDYGT